MSHLSPVSSTRSIYTNNSEERRLFLARTIRKFKKNISIIKKLKIGCRIINKLNNVPNNIDLIILCTPMSQYQNVIMKINKYISNTTIVTDVGSTKELTSKKVRKL